MISTFRGFMIRAQPSLLIVNDIVNAPERGTEVGTSASTSRKR
jgi:hypothetical protein